MQGGQIDIAISPSYVTMSALLRFARRGDVVVAHTLRRAAAEALELIVHGDARSSRVIGRTIEQVEMPRGAIDRRDRSRAWRSGAGADGAS